MPGGLLSQGAWCRWSGSGCSQCLGDLGWGRWGEGPAAAQWQGCFGGLQIVQQLLLILIVQEVCGKCRVSQQCQVGGLGTPGALGALTIWVEEEEGTSLDLFLFVVLPLFLVHLHVFIEPKPEAERASETRPSKALLPRF